MTQHKFKKPMNLLGVASGIAANLPGSCMGPVVLKASPFLQHIAHPHHWINTLYPNEQASGKAALPAVTTLCQKIAQQIAMCCEEDELFAVIGGDHSHAIGTWQGAAHATEGDLGLIWVDAHLDAHTPDTSLTQNIHGMPVACLLGDGDHDLCHLLGDQPAIKPENLCMIGIRSYHESEKKRMEKLGVRVFYMDDITDKNLPEIMREALSIVTRNTNAFGISIDLDAMDPLDAPAVSVPEPGGINATALIDALQLLHRHPALIGMEISEFNPGFDKEHITEQLICDLIAALVTEKKND